MLGSVFRFESSRTQRMGADEDTSGKSFSGINLLSTLCQIKPFHQVTIVFSSYFPSRLSRENKKTIVYLASKDLTANKKKENVVGGWSLLGKKCPWALCDAHTTDISSERRLGEQSFGLTNWPKICSPARSLQRLQTISSSISPSPTGSGKWLKERKGN